MGLNTGWVVMGNLGSYERVSFTVIGDAVNVAARLKGHAEGGQIVIGESTEHAIREIFDTIELAPVMVKGKALPLRTYRVIGEKTAVNADEAEAPAETPAKITNVTYASEPQAPLAQSPEGR